MRTRVYQQNDFERVIQLWWTAWHSSSGYRHHRPINDWKQRWRNLEKTHRIMVVEHQAEIIAFAAMDPQQCLLSQLFVSPSWKSRDLGKQLMSWATSQYPKGFTLKTAIDNAEANAFYQALGLVETNRSINEFNRREEIEYSTSYLY